MAMEDVGATPFRQFSLMEILVVATVIIILGAIISTTYTNYIARAQVTKLLSRLHNIELILSDEMINSNTPIDPSEPSNSSAQKIRKLVIELQNELPYISHVTYTCGAIIDSASKRPAGMTHNYQHCRDELPSNLRNASMITFTFSQVLPAGMKLYYNFILTASGQLLSICDVSLLHAEHNSKLPTQCKSTD